LCVDLFLKDCYKEDDLVVGYQGQEEIWYDNPIGAGISDNAILESKKQLCSFSQTFSYSSHILHILFLIILGLVDTEIHLAG
jgi:hypothetical protein